MDAITLLQRERGVFAPRPERAVDATLPDNSCPVWPARSGVLLFMRSLWTSRNFNPYYLFDAVCVRLSCEFEEGVDAVP